MSRRMGPRLKRDGVLASQDLRAAEETGWIVSREPLEDRQFQPASVDLRLGRVAHQLRASFLPFRRTITERLHGTQIDFTDPDLVIDSVSLSDGAVLQRNEVYLVELLEGLD